MIPMVIDLYHDNAMPPLFAIWRAGVRGIIHKCTTGVGGLDVTYAPRRQTRDIENFHWGAYHWGTNSDVQSQVTHFLTCASPDKNTLVALDWESDPNQMTLSQTKEWCQTIEQKLGRKPKLYSRNVLIEALKGQPDAYLSSLDLWMPEYGPTPHLPVGFSKCWLWQYTDGQSGPEPHRIPGYSETIDGNYFAGTEDELRASWV